MIDQQTIDRIIDTAQIVDVVSEFVTLRRRGINYIGLCPFHADKSPSFNVSPTKNICKCFSCGEGGTPVGFLMKKEQMSFYEAIRWLGRKYGIEVEEKRMNDEDRLLQTNREGMLNLNEFAQKCFEDDLFNHPEGRNVGLAYFRERGINDETIHRFHLGYAVEDKEDLARRAMQRGHKREYLLDGTGVGLCYGDDPRKTPICRFAGRVIFPHHSLSGKCIAFGGRILQRVDHAFKKYVNSPESAIYHKSDLPYGLFEAKNAIARENLCYVVEGNVDVLSMSQAGFQNVIAASGTALTTEHIRIIQRFTRNCVLMFDADDAGINAALKSIDLLLLEGMNVRLLLLPPGDDPDSFCRKHSSEEVARYFKENQQDFISFKTKMLLKGINPYDPYAKAQVAQNVANSVALISDPITMSILVGQVSQHLELSEPDVMRYVNQAKQNNYQAEVRKMEVEARREQARKEREELGLKENAIDPPQLSLVGREQNELASGGGFVATNGAVPASNAPTTASHTPATASNGANVPANGTAYPTAPQTASQPASQPASPVTNPINVSVDGQNSLPLREGWGGSSEGWTGTHRFERNIIKQIVRHGGELFPFCYYNQDTRQNETVNYRVIDFIYQELTNDELTLQHPLYARMYQLALDATVDPAVPWDSVRYFSNLYSDPEAQQLALNLMQDRYEALGVAQNNELLEVAIPRCILELKSCILRHEIEELTRQLRIPGNTSKNELLSELAQKMQIQKLFDKELGERVITPTRF